MSVFTWPTRPPPRASFPPLAPPGANLPAAGGGRVAGGARAEDGAHPRPVSRSRAAEGEEKRQPLDRYFPPVPPLDGFFSPALPVQTFLNFRAFADFIYWVSSAGFAGLSSAGFALLVCAGLSPPPLARRERAAAPSSRQERPPRERGRAPRLASGLAHLAARSSQVAAATCCHAGSGERLLFPSRPPSLRAKPSQRRRKLWRRNSIPPPFSFSEDAVEEAVCTSGKRELLLFLLGKPKPTMRDARQRRRRRQPLLARGGFIPWREKGSSVVFRFAASEVFF
ncbi:Hypothetical predicted protein [Podarcis lilfordi]|uniref:Uncharacterized protein n=1 Tax=Podarcis lilfordi TaxID=74358 RepID=A0AA35KGS5_9SAUR|nr:Hypothetical predicted protein [Podarcis lilfordi]